MDNQQAIQSLKNIIEYWSFSSLFMKTSMKNYIKYIEKCYYKIHKISKISGFSFKDLYDLCVDIQMHTVYDLEESIDIVKNHLLQGKTLEEICQLYN